MGRILKIGILGTRGIPNRYGGFEQCAEKLALGLAQKGHSVWVYNAHNHEYQGQKWNGVHIIHCNDPEYKLGTAGQFLYDFNCFRDARKRDFDILLQLGYTSSSIWYKIWPGQPRNIVNMDGLEWKRSKYNKYTQKFLKYAEKWAAINADLLIADSIGIRQHLQETYERASLFIPYGAEIFTAQQAGVLKSYRLQPLEYDMVMARMEPENNIEMIIKGFIASGTNRQLIIVGKTENKYGTLLENKYGASDKIKFLGGIYDQAVLNNLRYFSFLYFHGHSVGGTNPSLLEAMGTSALIAANDNIFNRSILGGDAFYFPDENGVSQIINDVTDRNTHNGKLQNNRDKIGNLYNWDHITDEYEKAFLQSLAQEKLP
jgi:glycosyltransferase involved in cell wall biosynthesis